MPVEAVALGWQAITVACTLAVSLLVMGFDLVGPDLVFGGLTALYVTTGIISIRDGAAGFSNTGVLTVLVLYLVAEGVSQTGGLDLAMNFMLGKASTVFWAQVRMMLPVMVASAFLNNTPICALMIPILISWGRRCGISPKKLLIPMSFATVLGGTMTLIGTSTNLVVSGLQEEKYGDTDRSKVFGFFDITPYGMPYGIWGMAYIILFSKWLLPGEDAADDLNYGLLVPRASPLAGKTAKAAGLAGGKLSITGISRGNRAPAVPYTHDMLIREGDTLFVTGSVTAVEQSIKTFGLVLLTSDDDVARKSTPGAAVFGAAAADVEEGFDIAASEGISSLLQVTVLKGAPIVGQSVKQIGFRGRFGAAVIAVKRSKNLQPGRIGDIVLQAGDVLLLSTGALFNAATEDCVKNFSGHSSSSSSAAGLWVSSPEGLADWPALSPAQQQLLEQLGGGGEEQGAALHSTLQAQVVGVHPSGCLIAEVAYRGRGAGLARPGHGAMLALPISACKPSMGLAAVTNSSSSSSSGQQQQQGESAASAAGRPAETRPLAPGEVQAVRMRVLGLERQPYLNISVQLVPGQQAGTQTAAADASTRRAEGSAAAGAQAGADALFPCPPNLLLARQVSAEPRAWQWPGGLLRVALLVAELARRASRLAAQQGAGLEQRKRELRQLKRQMRDQPAAAEEPAEAGQ
ncbi:hypothetical protein COO60DRAFT_1671656 [Scenedesmus sp. NREL 46B-D3]|nr:hypothetical protein COO60DRAFT_1671656 [Scenedesmus sp. NREL 46B-D3]